MKKLLFTLSLILSFNAYAANTCGGDLDNNCWDCGKTASDNCTARLDPDTKKLTITGDGYMADYLGGPLSNPSNPIRPWENDIENVEIETGIKSIGEYAFNSTQITSLTIPASVERIGMGSVQYIDTLENVTFEEDSNLKWIGSGAFNANPNLQSIEIPNSVEQISGNAFNKSAINSITLPDSIFLIDSIGQNDDSTVYFHGISLKALSDIDNIYCSEKSRSKCEEYFSKAQFWENGVYYPIKEKATLNVNNNDGSVDTYQWNTDGSFAIYRDGKFLAYKGKRIYTLDEANQVTGAKNRISIKYR